MVGGVTGETRWTAIMSTDMVGFTELSRSMDNEAVFNLLQEVLQLAQACVQEHGGKVVDTAGDGLLAAFGAPHALENAAAACCKAAFAFHQKLDEQSAALENRYGVVSQFRTGIAGGPTMIARDARGGFKTVGEAVNLASRLSALAEPGQILIDGIILAETEGEVDTVAHGPTALKGYDTPVAVHRITNLPERRSRFENYMQRGLVGFVSRAQELDQAMAAVNPENAPRILLISGVPGIGKSRLVYELVRRIGQQRKTYIGQCVPQGRSPALGPVHDILRQSGLGPAIAAPVSEDKLQDPLATALEARALAHDQLRALHDQQKALVVIEDAHWIDSATNDLIAAISRDPVPMIVTCRPEFTAPWTQAASVTHITLEPLKRPEISSIAQEFLGEAISQNLSDLIWKKSEGVPLVVEEITRTLRQSDQLRAGASGLDVADSSSLALTGNLEQLVLSRVDALPETQRTVLRVASAIGRVFSKQVLAQVSMEPCDDEALEKMGGLVEPAGPDHWKFSHALIQDAVYNSQLSRQRQTFHLRIAETLEVEPTNGSKRSSLLAEHYSKANKPFKAVHFLLQSARENLQVYAFEQVDRLLNQAMAFVDEDPQVIDDDDLADLAVTWLRALEQWGDFGKMAKVANRVLPRLEVAPYTPRRAIARTLIAIANAHARDYDTAEQLADATLAEAAAHNDEWGAAWAKVALMRIYEETLRQSPDVTEALAADIAPVAAKTGDRHLAMSAKYLLSSVYRSTGRRLKALEVAQEIHVFSETYNDGRAQAYAAWAKALVFGIEGNLEAALDIIEPVREKLIPGSGDESVFELISLYGRAMQTPFKEIEAELNAARSKALLFNDFNLIHTLTWVIVFSHFLAGHLSIGWRMLDKLISDGKIAGNMTVVRTQILSRAEFQLIICGLIDPVSEAPASRPILPKDPPKLPDLAWYAWLRLTGKRRAAADFEEVIALDPLQYGTTYARAHIGLGLIAKSRNQKQKADKHLKIGLEAAQAEGLDLLVRRAAAAMDSAPITAS